MAQRQTGGRGRAFIFLVISALAAILAVVVIYRMIQSYQEQLAKAQEKEELTKVVVAAHTLYPGQTLTDTDLVIKELPPAYVPETVFHEKEEVIGRVPAERIIGGEYVRRERLADPEAGVGLNAIIPRGMRALSVNITDGSAVSGFVNPTNYVDVIVTISPDSTGGKLQTVTMLQAKKVLAVNNRLGDAEGPDAEPGGRPSITLALTPQEAEKLTHAHVRGDVTLTLRNDVDVTQVKTSGAHSDKLIGRADAPAVPVGPVKPKRQKGTPPPADLLIIRGSNQTHEKVDSQGNTTIR